MYLIYKIEYYENEQNELNSERNAYRNDLAIEHVITGSG